MSCDAEDECALNRFIDEAGKRAGRVDALVFAAGKAYRGSVLDLDANDWDACLRINLRAPFLAAKRVLPIMIAQGRGTLVFVSSIWAVSTPRSRAAYVVAKAGLPALARALAIDHADQGIRVNVVAPGYVDNEFLRTSIAAVHGAAKVQEVLTNVLAAHPSGQLVTPEQVAQTISFLAGTRASGVNGQTLIVDGASTVRFALADMWR